MTNITVVLSVLAFAAFLRGSTSQSMRAISSTAKDTDFFYSLTSRQVWKREAAFFPFSLRVSSVAH